MTSVRVLFDGHWWPEGPTSNRSVMRAIVTGWVRAFPSDDVWIAGPGPRPDDLPDAARWVSTRIPQHGLATMVELPVVARRVRPDIVVTHNFAPISGRATRAVFVHDFMFVTNPEWFTSAERQYFRVLRASLRRADRIFTSSGTEAARIDRTLRPAQPTTPVGLALPDQLVHAEPTAPAWVEGLEGYLLTVGRLNVRKNLERAIQGALRSGACTPSRPLVVVGEAQGKVAALSAEAEGAIATGAIRMAGFVSDGELAYLYAHTDLFVFVSLDEGFGMPCIEASYFAAPIVASDIAVFREILGTTATFADPTDARAIAASITTALADPRPTAPIARYDWDGAVQTLRSTALEAHVA
ncbi:MAG: glycosyltransferase family 4 protein [Solirubrobacteraceae bacterium]|nr:glycosyltransferase family 4 protein [Solirubrobacteraceae bacterium]